MQIDNFKKNLCVRLSSALGLALLTLVSALAILPQPALAGTVSAPNCTEAGLIAQLQADGEAIFDASCDGATIVLTESLDLDTDIGVVSNTYVIDGNGFVTLTTDGDNRFFLIDNIATTLELRDIILTGGSSINASGGAIRIEAGTLNILNSSLISNVATVNGRAGAIEVRGGSVWIQNSAILSNTSVQNGGGIRNRGGTLHILNSTIAFNRNTGAGFDGGGLAISSVGGPSNTFITNTTIISNSANDRGGGIYQDETTFSSTVSIRNSIVALNSAGSADLNCAQAAGTLTDAGVNITESVPNDADCASHFVISPTIASTLGPLTDNGDGTTPHFPLLAGSVAIDAVTTPADCTVADDQLETDRPQDGDGDGVALCDVGSFEFVGFPTVSIAGPGTVDEDVGTATITVTLSMTHTENVTITLGFVDDTATNGADYTPPASQIVFTSGQTETTRNITIVDDAFDEPDEVFTVTMMAQNASLDTAPNDAAELTIVDNDQITAVFPVSTVNEGAGTATISVTLDITSTSEVTVAYSTVDDTAVSTEDYVAVTGVLTYPAGTDEMTFTVTITDDLIVEGDQDFILAATSFGGDFFGFIQGSVTIEDNDPVGIRISDTMTLEGNNAVFTVTIDQAHPTEAVTVTYTTSDGSAVAPGDYTADAGMLTFPAGTTTLAQEVPIPTLDDNLFEGTETFTMTLLDASDNATILDIIGIGTIVDAQVTPTLTITDLTVSESDFTIPVTITVDQPSALAATVQVTVTSNSGLLFVGPVLFTPAQTDTLLAAIPNPFGDLFDEPDEVITVEVGLPATNIEFPSNPATAIVTVTDDDVPIVRVENDIVTEGASATIYTTLSITSTRDITFSLITVDGSAESASDYVFTAYDNDVSAGGTGLVSPDWIPITDDLEIEGTETFSLALLAVSPFAQIGSSGVVTITDNDIPDVFIGDVTDIEGLDFTFVVSLSQISTTDATVDYATADGTAVNGSDYTGESGTLTISAGDLTGTITISITDDLLDENDETFTVTLTNATNANITDNEGIGTITDNDVPPEISINDVAVNEGDGTAVFTVSLSAASGLDVTVDFTTTDGSATGGGTDYASILGMLTFLAGITEQTISVTINNDAISEGDETFTIDLSGAVNATIIDAQGVGTIVDDDVAVPDLTIDDVTTIEGLDLTFVVSLSEVNTIDVTVDYVTVDGTASSIADEDYTALSDTLTIPAGNLTGTITVNTTVDALDENNETFTVTLSNASNANITDAEGIGTITDNDSQPTISIDDVTVNEGDGTAVFTLSLSAESGLAVTVDFETNDVTATGGADYTTTTGTVTFVAGTTVQTVEIQITDDVTAEGVETFTLDLSNPINATIIDAEGIGTIVDNDSVTPTVSIADASATEGPGATATFTVTLDVISPVDVSVQYDTSAGSATGGSDYNSVTGGNLTIGAGDLQGTVQISIIDDNLFEVDETFTVTLSSPTNVILGDAEGIGTIVSDDVVGVTINELDGVAATEGGMTDLYQISLTSEPAETVTVTATSDSQLTTVADLTFTSSNWNAPQTVNVTAVDDTDVEGPHIGTISHTVSSADTNYDGISVASVSVAITDNDQTAALLYYLPLILKNQIALLEGQDLTVESVTPTTSGVTIVIKNNGSEAITVPFWVDLYINPTETPTVNKTWQEIAPNGAAWGITQAMAPGEALAITIGDIYYDSAESSPGTLTTGDVLWVQVDSINRDNVFANVDESNETNNVFGPVSVTVTSRMAPDQVAEPVPAPLGDNGLPWR